MLRKSMLSSIALAAIMLAAPAVAQQPFDQSKYPNMAGQ